MKIGLKFGGHYTLNNDVNEGSNEYLKAGTEVIAKGFNGKYVLVQGRSRSGRSIKTYVQKDDLSEKINNSQSNKPRQSKIVKSPTVSQSDLVFLKEATEQLHKNPEWYTYRNDENSYIALRMESSINIFRIEPVANFEGVLKK